MDCKGGRGSGCWNENSVGFRERRKVFLLSRNTGDPTVGGLRAEKEKRSTQSRLRVDSGLGSFLKLQEVGVSPYLICIPILSTL